MSLYSPRREKTIESYLLERCRSAGLLSLKFTSPARRGVPDRIVIGPRATVFIEIKRPGARARRDQREMHEKMRRHGGWVRVINDQSGVDALLADLCDPFTVDELLTAADRGRT